MSTPPGGQDRRQHPRHDVGLRLTWTDLSNLRESLTQNISHGGCLVIAAAAREVGSQAALLLSHPASGEQLSLTAEVRRCDALSDGRFAIGLQFVAFEDPLREKIAAFVDSAVAAGPPQWARASGAAAASAPTPAPKSTAPIPGIAAAKEVPRDGEAKRTSPAKRVGGIIAVLILVGLLAVAVWNFTLRRTMETMDAGVVADLITLDGLQKQGTTAYGIVHSDWSKLPSQKTTVSDLGKRLAGSGVRTVILRDGQDRVVARFEDGIVVLY